MNESRIWIVDDESEALFGMETVLRISGLGSIHCFQDDARVIPELEVNPPDVILLDLGLMHSSGKELLEKITGVYPDLPVLVVTGDDGIESAVECMKLGAFDYLLKPVSRERLVTSVRRSLEWKSLKTENKILQETLLKPAALFSPVFKSFITQSATLIATLRYAESIAPLSSAVLVTGETGTGKELLARILHQLSGRKGKFVSVNAAGLDDSVFSDTLFGHNRGAFTGATENRPGLIQEAAEGTLFLDEIGDLSPISQVKLLRVLQEGEYFPLGSDLPKNTSARVIAATNKNLNELQQTGMFRKDLYYRLSSHQILLPPLRERKGDLPLLVKAFFEEASGMQNKKIPLIPEELYPLLSTYAFPGNIRELRSMVQDALASHRKGILSLSSFKRIIQERNSSRPISRIPNSKVSFSEELPTLRECEEFLVEEAVKRSAGNQSLAASLLGISRQALHKRLKSKSNYRNLPGSFSK